MDQAEQELIDAAREFAQNAHTRWQPRLVVETFARPVPIRIGSYAVGPLTLRGWLALDAARSPFLNGETFSVDELPERLADALAALTGTPVSAGEVMERIPPAEVPAAIQALYALCSARFVAFLNMVPPGEPGELRPDDGFGECLPLHAAFVTQLNLTPDAALDLPIDRGVMLLNAKRHNDGWRAEGVNYRDRDWEDSPAEPAKEGAQQTHAPDKKTAGRAGEQSHRNEQGEEHSPSGASQPEESNSGQ